LRRSTCLFILAAWPLIAGAEKSRPRRPEVWRFPERPPRIHIAKGLWWDMYRVHEAGAMMGGAIYDESFDVFGHSSGYCGYGKTLGDFPHAYAKLLRFNTIVITGCRAGALPAASQERLKGWGENGGGLLVTGGIQGLGQGGYHGSVLEQLLPAEISEKPDLKRTPPGTLLQPTEAGRGLFGRNVPWRQKPRLLYAHDGLEVKAGAEVLLEAASKPILIRHSQGEGRVALFAGTLCGEPEPGELAFWDWDGWPMVLSRVLEWLVETPAAGAGAATTPRDPKYAEKLAELKELTDVDVDGMFDEEEDEGMAAPKSGSDTLGRILKLAPACRDAEYALAIVQALAESGTSFDVLTAEAILKSILPHITGKEFLRPGRDLVSASVVGRVALGLRILGRLKAPEGHAVVLKYVARGLSGLPKQPGQGSLAPSMRVETGEDERLRLAAVRAVADYADRKLLSAFRKAASAWQKTKSPPPEVVELQQDLEEEIQVALCLMGDGRAAVTVVNTMVQNKLNIEMNLDITQRPLYVPTPSALSERKQAARAIPFLRARNARLARTLARFPETGLPLLAESAREWEGEFADVFLQACLAERDDRTPDEGTCAALLRIVKECQLGGTRTLCAHRVSRTGNGDLPDALAKLSKGEEEDALFALARLPFMPKDTRDSIVRDGIGHKSSSVRQKAARAIVLVPEAKRGPLAATARELAKDDRETAAILERLGLGD